MCIRDRSAPAPPNGCRPLRARAPIPDRLSGSPTNRGAARRGRVGCRAALRDRDQALPSSRIPRVPGARGECAVCAHGLRRHSGGDFGPRRSLLHVTGYDGAANDRRVRNERRAGAGSGADPHDPEVAGGREPFSSRAASLGRPSGRACRLGHRGLPAVADGDCGGFWDVGVGR